MATAIPIPIVDESTQQVTIVRWAKRVGEPVVEGELLLEVETDKALMEIESIATGVVLAVLADASDEVPVGTTVAVVGEAGEDISQYLAAGPADVD